MTVRDEHATERRAALGERPIEGRQVPRVADAGVDERSVAGLSAHEVRIVAPTRHRAWVVRFEQDWRKQQSKTIAESQRSVRVPTVLPEEIVGVATDEHAGEGRAPVRPLRL